MTVNLGKGKTFSIKEITDNKEVVVNVSDGIYLSSITVKEGAQSSKSTYAVCDEALTLYDGKTVKRIKDTIFVE